MSPAHEDIQLQMERQMLRHCAPIFFLPAHDSLPGEIYANGTVGLFSKSNKRFLVTCAHVYDEFTLYREKHPAAMLATIFSDGYRLPIALDGFDVVWIDRDADLVAFALPSTCDFGSKAYYDLEHIHEAKKSDVVACLGFSKAGRVAAGNIGGVNFTTLGLSVSDVSDRRILLAHGSPRHSTSGLDQEIGGMSGSPAYTISPSGLILTGFLTEGKTLAGSIFLTHARSVAGAI